MFSGESAKGRDRVVRGIGVGRGGGGRVCLFLCFVLLIDFSWI